MFSKCPFAEKLGDKIHHLENVIIWENVQNCNVWYIIRSPTPPPRCLLPQSESIFPILLSRYMNKLLLKHIPYNRKKLPENLPH